MNRLLCLLIAFVLAAPADGIRAQTVASQTEDDYYRLISVSTSQAQTDSRAKTWKPAPDGLALEVSGIAVLDEHRVAVAIRKGEVWILDGNLWLTLNLGLGLKGEELQRTGRSSFSGCDQSISSTEAARCLVSVQEDGPVHHGHYAGCQ